MNKVILSLFFLFESHYSMSQKFFFRPVKYLVFDSLKGKDLMHQCGSRNIPQNISGYWNLNYPDIELIEKNFKKIRKLRSDQCCNKGYRILNLKKYGFQYVGLIIDNKKYIYLNAFPESEFVATPVIVCDGGVLYWGVLFDIYNLNFSQLAFNGPPISVKDD